MCGVAALARIPFIKQLLDTSNFEKDWVGLAMWYISYPLFPRETLLTCCSSVIEPGLGIIAASLAAFRPLFGTERWHLLSSKLSSRNLLSRASKSGTSGTGGTEKTEGSMEEGGAGIKIIKTVHVDKEGENNGVETSTGGDMVVKEQPKPERRSVENVAL